VATVSLQVETIKKTFISLRILESVVTHRLLVEIVRTLKCGIMWTMVVTTISLYLG
jgi:hypothetical protein